MEEQIKTAAELEAEARARARAEIAGEKTTSEEIPPGQPKVVQHNKPKSKRTLIVSIFSLVVLILLATGGDYLMGMLKGDKGDKNETKAPASNGMSSANNERHDMGQDINPFAGKEDKEEKNTDQQQQQQTSPPQSPVSFSKASALAGVTGSVSSSDYQQTSQHNTSSATTQAYDETAQCKKVLVRGADGNLYCPDTPNDKAESSNIRENDGIARITGVTRLNLDPNLYIPVDRYIPCSMMRRFVSDVAGSISCMISEDVYSANNYVRLIPAGTIARGIYRSGTLKHGVGRMFIAWTELRTPEPSSLRIPLMDSQAVGQLGENGIAGWIDSHWAERIGNTILLGTVQDFAAGLADAAPGKDRNTDYTENTRAATAEMAKAVLDNSINIPPTMYLNQGDVIGIMTAADIDFSGVYKLKAR
ncbi:TPA: VirB10/TraB/TrbI family type IV secretion system protein [Salmonella enterica subsp. enterica serovar Java]